MGSEGIEIRKKSEGRKSMYLCVKLILNVFLKKEIKMYFKSQLILEEKKKYRSKLLW